MLDQQINEQLGLLQNELLRLKAVTDYIDGAKENSMNVIAELESIQKNYSLYTDKLYNTYKQNIDDLKKSTEFLEKYVGIVELTNSLLAVLTDINLPKKLSGIDNSVREAVLKLSEIQNKMEQNLLLHLAKQDKELKQIKIFVVIICFFTCSIVTMNIMNIFMR